MNTYMHTHTHAHTYVHTYTVLYVVDKDSLLVSFHYLCYINSACAYYPHTQYSNHINSFVSDIATGSVLPTEENTNCYCSHQSCQQVSTFLLSGCGV